MFPMGYSLRSRDPQEERAIWDWALTRDKQLDNAIAKGRMAQLMPGAPPGIFTSPGAASPQSAQVQVQTQREIPSRLLHLTTQPSGYISPLASLSSEGRAIINDSYQAAKDIVDKAAAGPFAWADKLTLETLQQGGVSSHFKPASALNLPFIEMSILWMIS